MATAGGRVEGRVEHWGAEVNWLKGRLWVGMEARVRQCVCVGVGVSVGVGECVAGCVSAGLKAWLGTHARMRTHTRTPTHAHTRTHAYVHTQIRTYAHTPCGVSVGRGSWPDADRGEAGAVVCV